MNVIVADVLGMCFGVRDALEIIENIDQPERVTIHGELVHNEQVLDKLDRRGFQQTDEKGRHSLPLTDQVLITAHGISRRERQRLQAGGKTLIDSTCPLVARAHEAAQKLQAEGRHVIVIGKPGHVEVQGIVEDLHSFDLAPTPEHVKRYPHNRLGVMCQTTTPEPLAAAIRNEIKRLNPQADIRFIDTICLPTKEHQHALERMLDQVEGVVVVGGRNSNNTRQLVERCRERGLPAFHVQEAGDLDPNWFHGLENVGLTAGTSTLEETIRDVHQTLMHMSSAVAA
ncbi:MAG: 4-hydroxy-3-methylbut-2-enyl diphosphate reductase [Gemmataceae bacterium]|nr:4-hydroxy-3-methylbut-2-enyl diphosphate reductase [Gemmataceae bacterium]